MNAAKLKVLAGEYAHVYSFVRDDTMPRKHKELNDAIDSVFAQVAELKAENERLKVASDFDFSEYKRLRDELKRQRDEYKADAERYRRDASDLTAIVANQQTRHYKEIDELKRQNAEHKADAERYRHMRSHALFQDRNGPGLYWYLPRDNRGLPVPERLDAAIDAMKGASNDNAEV